MLDLTQPTGCVRPHKTAPDLRILPPVSDLPADAPPPVDADEPPPRKRGLGRGLAELATAGRSIGVDGQPYYGLDSLLWSLDRAHARRAAERTPQPKALHRLPEPVDTGSLRVADILSAATDTATPQAAQIVPEVPKPRSLAESAAILNRALAHPSEAIRVAEPEVVEPEPEPEPSTRVGRGKWANWGADDE